MGVSDFVAWNIARHNAVGTFVPLATIAAANKLVCFRMANACTVEMHHPPVGSVRHEDLPFALGFSVSKLFLAAGARPAARGADV